VTRAIFKVLTTLDIRVHVVCILGRVNVLVNSLNRIEITGDHALDMTVFQQAVRLLEVSLTVDFFARKINRTLERFGWKGELPYTFPPVQLVYRVLQRIQE
jgi:hypothetical protein